jgi:hypothetical protein
MINTKYFQGTLILISALFLSAWDFPPDTVITLSNNDRYSKASISFIESTGNNQSSVNSWLALNRPFTFNDLEKGQIQIHLTQSDHQVKTFSFYFTSLTNAPRFRLTAENKVGNYYKLFLTAKENPEVQARGIFFMIIKTIPNLFWSGWNTEKIGFFGKLILSEEEQNEILLTFKNLQ